MALGDLIPDGLGPLGIGVGRVEEHQERLAQLLQLPDHPLLRLQIVLPGNLGDGAVGGDHDADGGVLSNHFSGAYLGGLRHGDLMVKPWSGDHALGLPLQLSHCSGHHVAHTINEPHLERRRGVHGHGHRLLRNKLGLCRHDGPPGAALGQLIPGPLPAIDVVDVGDDQTLHHPFDEGGLSGAHRPHHTDVDIAVGPTGDILIDFALFHCHSSLLACLGISLHCMRISCRICPVSGGTEKRAPSPGRVCGMD